MFVWINFLGVDDDDNNYRYFDVRNYWPHILRLSTHHHHSFILGIGGRSCALALIFDYVWTRIVLRDWMGINDIQRLKMSLVGTHGFCFIWDIIGVIRCS